MTASSPRGPVEQWRGFDPSWGDASYSTTLVEARCEVVADELAKIRGCQRQAIHLDADTMTLATDEWPLFVMQLKGHAWTQIFSHTRTIAVEEAMQLSRLLTTRVFEYAFYHIGGVCWFRKARSTTSSPMRSTRFARPTSSRCATAAGKTGWREMIQHGVTGFLGKCDEELAHYTAMLAYDEDLRMRIVHAARERLVNELASPDVIWAG